MGSQLYARLPTVRRTAIALKSSRLRQYLTLVRWMRQMVHAEAVPGFLHISLFLFFAGLGDSLLNINTKVALSNIVPIGISGLLYIFMIFAPIIYPQSPYQSLFSGILWYLIQKSRGRRFRDHRSDGEMKSVSANMAQGQMQLAMEETVARKGRDVRAIRWLIDNMTEDAEMEKLYPARLTRTGARKSGRGWANTRMDLLRDHAGIQQLTNLYPLGVSAVSLGQSFTLFGNPLPVIPLPMQ